jgi:hypothetical protein
LLHHILFYHTSHPGVQQAQDFELRYNRHASNVRIWPVSVMDDQHTTLGFVQHLVLRGKFLLNHIKECLHMLNCNSAMDVICEINLDTVGSPMLTVTRGTQEDARVLATLLNGLQT